jgi:cysteine synthase A
MTPLPAETEARLQGLGRLIGNTPLLSVDYTFRGRRRRIFAKSESLNMTGSVKDRVALHLLRRAYETRALQPGAVIVEAAQGNAAISLSAVGRALGHPVALFMPDWLSAERMSVVRSFGASIYPIGEEGGGFLGAVGRAEELASQSPGSFLPRSFANEDSCGAHEATTGPEIHWQLGAHGLAPDAFVAGVGTGGTVMGVGRYLVAHHPEVRIHPVEPSDAPVLSTGKSVGRHRVPGFSEELVPPLLDLTELDHVVAVDDGDAILMAQKLARALGLGVGISSGANFLGAVLVQDLLGGDAVVTTLFPDSNRLYLSTDLFRDEPPLKDHLAPWVELEGFTAFNRACPACDTSAELVRLAAGI